MLGLNIKGLARKVAMHWELSEKFEAWHLPLVPKFVQRQSLQKVT